MGWHALCSIREFEQCNATILSWVVSHKSRGRRDEHVLVVGAAESDRSRILKIQLYGAKNLARAGIKTKNFARREESPPEAALSVHCRAIEDASNVVVAQLLWISNLTCLCIVVELFDLVMSRASKVKALAIEAPGWPVG